MRVKVSEVDVKSLQSNSEKALEAALYVTAENILSDCSQYVPYETGDLKNSGRSEVSGGHGYVMWGTDQKTAQYARVQYYGESFDHSTNANMAMSPRACAKWFEAARTSRGDDWNEMFKKQYLEGCHG